MYVEFSLCPHHAEDTVQVDCIVSNVGDCLYDIQLYIDVIEQILPE